MEQRRSEMPNLNLDKHISDQLSKTHKNPEVYKAFSERLKEMGFNRLI